MVLRTGELFVRDALLKYLGSSNIRKVWEGENPPDIYIKTVEGTIAAAEITRLSPISFDQEGSIENRKSQDYFGMNLCDKLDSKLKCFVPEEVDIVITLYTPIQNARKFTNGLHRFLKGFITKDLKAGDREQTTVAGEKIDALVIPNRDYSQRKIVGIIANKHSDPNILLNAKIILADRIKAKQEKSNRIDHNGPIWLALFNDYWLADHETYAQAIKDIDIEHNFEN